MYTVQRSKIEPDLLEIRKGDSLVQEIYVPFELGKIPEVFDSVEGVFAWVSEREMKRAKSYALWLLSRKGYSKRNLEKKLKEKRYSNKVSLEVLQKMEDLGYLSDEDLTLSIIKKKIAQGYGPGYIRQYLFSQGLKAEGEIMTEEEERESIEKWKKKLKGKDPAKIFAYLQRRGFTLLRNLF